MSVPKDLPVIFRNSPHLVMEHEGYRLLIVHQDVPDATWPTVRVEFPDRMVTNEKGKEELRKGGHVEDQLLLQWFNTFDSEEEIAESQRRALWAEKERDETKAKDRAQKKEIGALKRQVAELEAQLAADRAEIISEMAKRQIKSLQTQVIDSGTEETK